MNHDDLLDFIDDTEKRLFRTGHDTGANRNALLVWNCLREFANLPPLTMDDLIQRHANSKGWPFDKMKHDYKVMDRFRYLEQTGMNQVDAINQAIEELGEYEAN